MFRLLVLFSGAAMFFGLLFPSDGALLAAVVFALLARLAQADEQHRALLAALRGEQPPPAEEQKSTRQIEREWRKMLRERGPKD